MNSFFKWFFIILVVVVTGMAGYVAIQPAHFEVMRWTTIDAPPDVVFEQVNEFPK